jgi:hypothetical protein
MAISQREARAADSTTWTTASLWLEGSAARAWQQSGKDCQVGTTAKIITSTRASRVSEAMTQGRRPQADYSRRIFPASDRYRLAGRTPSLSGISTFGFGVRPMMQAPTDSGSRRPVAIDGDGRSVASIAYRLLVSSVGAAWTGRLQAKRFCDKPFSQMPEIFK